MYIFFRLTLKQKINCFKKYKSALFMILLWLYELTNDQLNFESSSPSPYHGKLRGN